MLERIKISKLRFSQNINIHQMNFRSKGFFSNTSTSLQDIANDAKDQDPLNISPHAVQFDKLIK